MSLISLGVGCWCFFAGDPLGGWHSLVWEVAVWFGAVDYDLRRSFTLM